MILCFLFTIITCICIILGGWFLVQIGNETDQEISPLKNSYETEDVSPDVLLNVSPDVLEPTIKISDLPILTVIKNEL